MKRYLSLVPHTQTNRHKNAVLTFAPVGNQVRFSLAGKLVPEPDYLILCDIAKQDSVTNNPYSQFSIVVATFFLWLV